MNKTIYSTNHHIQH